MLKLESHNFQTYYASIFVKALYSFGLKHVIISPGSRNTPLTLAFAAHPHIKKHVAVDERSAGFMALGIGMSSGDPAVLVCTSGTAPANYFPAVIEAQKSGVPMIVLSADRGFDESNTGANQWIDQSNLYGNKAVFFAHVHIRPNHQNDLYRIKLLAEQTWSSSVDLRGCSHINFPFSKPLEPDAAFLSELPFYYSETENTEIATSERVLATWTPPLSTFDQINESKRPLIICGSGTTKRPLSDVLGLFSNSAIPILSEAGTKPVETTGNYLFGFNAYLRKSTICESLNPDLIIRIGDEPVGKGLLNYLKIHSKVPVIHFYDRENWINSSFSNETRIVVPGGAKIQPCHNEFIHHDRSSWVLEWKSKESNFLAFHKDWKFSRESFRDGDVYKVISRSIDSDEILMISNSLPARDIDLFGMPELSKNKIFMNRGASGIDGITSTALGIALESGKRVTLVTGDLAFIHDISALVTIVNEKSIQLRIIVINNNGGQLFRMLPILSATEYFTNYFETPQHINIANVAKAVGIPSICVEKATELESAFSIQDRITLIECKTDPETSMILRTELWS
jgi:2-succinyl-5-enolpyruvyl-6-hydroxy-3-cyclohexene-1-carboxylate synthase